MHIVAKNGNKRILKILLERNPIISISNKEGVTPIMLATGPTKTVNNYINEVV